MYCDEADCVAGRLDVFYICEFCGFQWCWTSELRLILNVDIYYRRSENGFGYIYNCCFYGFDGG